MEETKTEAARHKTIRLVVGLGNPGDQYQNNRHNVGFWFLDMLAEKYGLTFRKSPHGKSCGLMGDEGNIWFFQPGTYVNLSGGAVSGFMNYYDLDASRLLLVHDDIDLPDAEIRLKYGGGHGGHNGVRDVIKHCGADFWRLRVGMSHPGDKSLVHDYVLNAPSRAETQRIRERLGQVICLSEELLAGRFERAREMLLQETKN